MLYLMLFSGNSGYANAPQFTFVRTWRIFLFLHACHVQSHFILLGFIVLVLFDESCKLFSSLCGFFLLLVNFCLNCRFFP